MAVVQGRGRGLKGSCLESESLVGGAGSGHERKEGPRDRAGLQRLQQLHGRGLGEGAWYGERRGLRCNKEMNWEDPEVGVA